MNFNEVLIKDSQLTRRWGNGKVFKGNVSGGHALFVQHFANQVLSGVNQQVPPIFILCMCYYDFCNKVSADSVVRNECPAVSEMTLSAAGGQYCC